MLNKLKEKYQEQNYLLEVLNLWLIAKEAGYEDYQIKAFTFRTEFLTNEQKRENRYLKQYPLYEDKYDGEKYHNCVRLTNGELAQIPLTERPKAVEAYK